MESNNCFSFSERTTIKEPEDDIEDSSSFMSDSDTNAGYAGSASSSEESGETGEREYAGSSSSNEESVETVERDCSDLERERMEINRFDNKNQNQESNSFSNDAVRYSKPTHLSLTENYFQNRSGDYKKSSYYDSKQYACSDSSRVISMNRNEVGRNTLRNSLAIYMRAHRKQDTFSLGHSTSKNSKEFQRKRIRTDHSKESNNMEDTPIYFIGPDIMAYILSYLDPPEVRNFITMPLSKDWQAIYTHPQDIWKTLCLSKPFYAKFDDSANENKFSTDTFRSFKNLGMRHVFGQFRFLYTSFVECILYLRNLEEDLKNGVSLLSVGKNNAVSQRIFRMRNRKRPQGNINKMTNPLESKVKARNNLTSTAGPSGNEVNDRNKNKVKLAKIGKSSLTARLLGSSTDRTPGYLKLPLSCALFSITNWMLAFSDVLGIQIMCLKALPKLLEDEHQRVAAQRASLTNIVLREMVIFSNSVELHTAAFHSFVLLARPLGGKEGKLFDSTVLHGCWNFNSSTGSGRKGIAVMLESLERFSSHETLQAMGCWSMVNIALIPSQKTVLVKLGGISAALNAMVMHQRSAEVQFRAAFALVNLVIPSESLIVDEADSDDSEEQLRYVTEKEVLDENVAQVVNLTVTAMKNFSMEGIILNRCCLVLHNVCLNNEYHSTLLWTPNCYQMLEWSLVNYPNDQVMQQSAGGTLQRLQNTLATDDNLRYRFAASIRAQL